MNRLTRIKNHYGDYEIIEESFSMGEDENQQCLNKLGQYEDIDEELGIEYPVLIKALLNGFDTQYNWHVNGFAIEIDLELKCFIDLSDKEHYYFEDYGKTWALNKEELL